jgi:NADH-quinone oxidoreductase subunit G
VLFGVEPGKDLADGVRALAALRAAKVVSFTPFVSDDLLDVADVLLPIATFAETPGTFVNAEGRWQSFDAAADLESEARPGWRVLRVLGNELELPGCEYRVPSDIADEIRHELGGHGEPQPEHNAYLGSFAPAAGRCAEALEQNLDVPIYAVDAVVRRSAALQETVLGRQGNDAR